MIRALAVLLLLATPAFAQEPKPPPVCQYNMDETVADLASRGIGVGLVSPETLPDLLEALAAAGLLPPGVITRAFVVDLSGTIKVGIEADGCLLPPIAMPVAAPAALRQSGRTPNGTFA